jgi:hypothetical protein
MLFPPSSDMRELAVFWQADQAGGVGILMIEMLGTERRVVARFERRCWIGGMGSTRPSLASMPIR